MSSEPRPNTLRERECALETLVRGIADEYKELHDGTSEYEAHLHRKIGALEMLADELGGIKHHSLPINFDTEIPF